MVEPVKDTIVDFVRDHDAALLQLNKTDRFSIRDSWNGVHVFGQIGSGKTSGAGKYLAGAFLRAGYGGIVLCAKPEEIELWKRYAKEHGREQSLFIFDESQGYNFITAELARKGADAIDSVTDTLLKIIEASDLAAGKAGKQSEQFWQQSSRQLLLYSVAILFGAKGTVTIADLLRFIDTAPTKHASNESEQAVLKKNWAVQMIQASQYQPVRPLPADIKLAAISYFCQTYLAIPEKTRGSIKITATASLARFATGMLRKCFCEQTTVLPEMCFSGAIIVVALPALTYNENGVIAGGLWKFLFQRAVEARNALPSKFQERPVFLWVDEAQTYVSEYDDTFLSTCRGSRCAVVYLTQSLPTYYGMLGKEKSDKVDGFVGKFANKIFHLNSDPRTNKYASDLIGRGIKTRLTISENETTGINTNRGGSQHMTNAGWNKSESSNKGTSTQEYEAQLLEANYFATSLRTGAPKNDFLVDAVWFRAGANFSEPIPQTNGNQILATFSQK